MPNYDTITSYRCKGCATVYGTDTEANTCYSKHQAVTLTNAKYTYKAQGALPTKIDIKVGNVYHTYSLIE